MTANERYLLLAIARIFLARLRDTNTTYEANALDIRALNEALAPFNGSTPDHLAAADRDWKDAFRR